MTVTARICANPSSRWSVRCWSKRVAWKVRPGYRRVAEPGGQPALLQRVLPDWAAPEVPVHAVFASARYLTPKVRAFIDLAAEKFRPPG